VPKKSPSRAPRNKTLTLSPAEQKRYSKRLLKLNRPRKIDQLINRTINADFFHIADQLPDNCIDLVFADPPYNLDKSFNGQRFARTSTQAYLDYLESWLPQLVRLMKPDASLYLCGDWRSAAAIQLAAEKYLILRSRITWEREKGRGTRRNWKNNAEDIWFCTKSNDYCFNIDAVKMKRRVLAPYTNNGHPKDWQQTAAGRFRVTHPSNLWTDLTIPFWSMPENTDHPAQKPEKLLAKCILAGSNPGDLVFDPFAGVGTTAVVAKKLNRRFLTVEIDPTYCCLAEKRLHLADHDQRIQGYHDGVFWERNSLAQQKSNSPR
jgi:site-specific DNA-methyltransferase (adenine-specific)